MLRWSFLLGIIFSCLLSSVAQVDQIWRYSYPEFGAGMNNNLYFRIENNNFVKNNEYFGDFTEGYTLMGYALQPSLMYYAGSQLRIKAGLHLVKYSGMEEFTEVVPTFSIHTKLSDNLDLIMGGLRGDVHHRLLEPLFNPENQYTRPIENGFQFIYDNDRLWLDWWIDWEQFIVIGDTKPEKFTAGISTEYNIRKDATDWQVSIPGQLIATHLGGQISNFEEPMQSLANMATGVKIRKEIGTGFIQRISLSTYGAWYMDLTEKSGLPFSKGQALYPVAEIGYKYGLLMLGYWHANNFVAPKGSHLFQSVSDYKVVNETSYFYEPKRDLLNAKLSFSKDFLQKIKFSVMVETYYDIPNAQFEYAYGMNLVFNPNFFLKKVHFD
ncbi:hypothetical protein [Carboxylicivirga caseinilyticus]|uniref:hypothetical protein n=1 Tax=Carboxylicivirga caseinilyticus TaxID=3417572 RepID=UPI003D355A9E|nr:hypothetical protein [Marinilabiliaceae bacterium A049]